METAGHIILARNGDAHAVIVPNDVRNEIAKQFGVAKRKLTAKKRVSARATRARDELARRLVKIHDFSYREAADYMNRTHAAIVYGVQRAEERLTVAALNS